jgi:tRNA dimethylallyltransferase
MPHLQETLPVTSPCIVVVTGPTAAGKSRLSLRLAESLGGEIISADSMQVYRRLNIGTAKPSPEDRARVPHSLVDYVDLGEPYHVARFLEDADAAISRVAAGGKVPVVCGGTALYLHALLFGLAGGPGRDPKVRCSLDTRWESGERGALWAELVRVDPDLARRLHPNDRSRVIRGLEVYAVSGRPMSVWQREHGFPRRRYSALLLGVQHPRAELYRRIDARALEMLEAGWVNEVEDVLAEGYSPSIPPLQAIGYREICDFLALRRDMPATVTEIQMQTRRLAKRQLTWFRRLQPEWVSGEDLGSISARIRKFLQTCTRAL